jgi:hypothetical protein
MDGITHKGGAPSGAANAALSVKLSWRELASFCFKSATSAQQEQQQQQQAMAHSTSKVHRKPCLQVYQILETSINRKINDKGIGFNVRIVEVMSLIPVHIASKLRLWH